MFSDRELPNFTWKCWGMNLGPYAYKTEDFAIVLSQFGNFIAEVSESYFSDMKIYSSCANNSLLVSGQWLVILSICRLIAAKVRGCSEERTGIEGEGRW